VIGSVRSWGGRAAAQARGLAIGAGLLSYESAISPPSVASWEQDYETGRWDYLGGIDQLARYSLLAGYVEALDGATILDVGCGVGLLRARLEHLDFERYVGIDPVAAAIERARERAETRSEYLVADVFDPGLGEFDIVICNEVLYALPDPGRQLDRIRDLLRPGGHVLTSSIRHPGDVGLERLLRARFDVVDAVEIANRTGRGTRRRRVGAYRRR
jgi:2-polyprenyl-6-hydroxyphenyl methylase/3-demethylubiquinone-9 3-methyltransferase